MGAAFSDADVAIGQPRPTVPERFGDYLRSANATELPVDGRCEQCGAGDGRWTLQRAHANPEGPYCARCLGYQHGYDLAEETVLRLVFAGAIAGALSAQVPYESASHAMHGVPRLALALLVERIASGSTPVTGRLLHRGCRSTSRRGRAASGARRTISAADGAGRIRDGRRLGQATG